MLYQPLNWLESVEDPLGFDLKVADEVLDVATFQIRQPSLKFQVNAAQLSWSRLSNRLVSLQRACSGFLDGRVPRISYCTRDSGILWDTEHGKRTMHPLVFGPLILLENAFLEMVFNLWMSWEINRYLSLEPDRFRVLGLGSKQKRI